MGLPSGRPGVRNFHNLYRGSVRLLRTLDRSELERRILEHIEAAVTDSAERRVAVKGVSARIGEDFFFLPARTRYMVASLEVLAQFQAEIYGWGYHDVDLSGNLLLDQDRRVPVKALIFVDPEQEDISQLAPAEGACLLLKLALDEPSSSLPLLAILADQTQLLRASHRRLPQVLSELTRG